MRQHALPTPHVVCVCTNTVFVQEPRCFGRGCTNGRRSFREALHCVDPRRRYRARASWVPVDMLQGTSCRNRTVHPVPRPHVATTRTPRAARIGLQCQSRWSKHDCCMRTTVCRVRTSQMPRTSCAVTVRHKRGAAAVLLSAASDVVCVRPQVCAWKSAARTSESHGMPSTLSKSSCCPRCTALQPVPHRPL